MTPEWLWGVLLFSRAILFGAALGLYYEFFRICRVFFHHPAWLVAVEDLLFFLPASLAHIFFHYAFGDGETRWFGVLGVVLGFLLYLASAGKIVRKTLIPIKERLSRLAGRMIRPVKERVLARREKRIRRKEEAKALKRSKRNNKTERNNKRTRKRGQTHDKT